MERKRKYNRHCLLNIQTCLPPVLLVTKVSSILLVCCTLFLLVDYGECIMTFPEDSGVYSLFPDEDLKTGRKRFRFDDETTRSYREGRDYSTLVRSYPMLPQDRLHRPVDFSGGSSRPDYDRDRDYRNRDRHGRVYFDDNFRTSRFDFHRLTPRPRPIERPLSPIIFETSRRPPLHFLPETFAPPPAIGQSKLPVGAASRASGEDNVPTRIHIFNPDSVNFGSPRVAGGGSGGGTSSERTKGPPSNFVETGPPGPDAFLNHDEFLEYQKKIAFARFHEQDASDGTEGQGNREGKKVLFESKEPFEIDGLIPPDKSGENSGKSSTTGSKVSGLQPSHGPPSSSSQRHHNHQHDQRQLQRQQEEGQILRVSPVDSHRHHHRQNVEEDGEQEERDTGGGEVESEVVNDKGEEVESENGKSEVTQLPPTHISKSGRAHGIGSGVVSASSSNISPNNKKFTPSVSHNVGGTGFKLPTTPVVSYSDEPPNLNGFVPVVPFHLIGEQPRAISLERPRQQQQHRIVPHHAPAHSTTPSSTTATITAISSSTPNYIPLATTASSTPSSTTARAKVEKLSFRPTTEVSPSSSFSIPAAGIDETENTSNGGGNINFSSQSNDDGVLVVTTSSGSSPASPILHATAGERSNSETHSKVAITKQQELKRLHKQRQQLPPTTSSMHQLTRAPHSGGIFPDIGFGDSSASSDSADNSDNPGTFTNTNHFSDYSTTPLHDDLGTSAIAGGGMSPSPTLQAFDDTSSQTLPTTTITPASSLPKPDQVPQVDAQDEHNTHNILQVNQFHIHTTFPSPEIQHSDDNHITGHTETDSKHDLTRNKHNTLTSSSSGDEAIKPPVVIERNEISDTRAVQIANGIRQGEFHLEGYMINANNNNGAGDSSSSSVHHSSRSNSDADYPHKNGDNNEENVDNPPNYHDHPHRPLYDYPDNEINHMTSGGGDDVHVGTSSSPIIPHHHDNDNNPLSPVIPQLPGTTTPDLEKQDLTPSAEKSVTPFQMSSTGAIKNALLASRVGSSSSAATTRQQQSGDGGGGDGDDVTGSEYAARNNDEPTLEEQGGSSSGSFSSSSGDVQNPIVAVDDLPFESEPSVPPELRRTRFSENDEGSYVVVAPTNPFYDNTNSNINNDENNEFGLYPYYGHFGNRINSSSLSSAGSSIPGSSDDSNFSIISVGGGDNFQHDENGPYENVEKINRRGKSHRHGSLFAKDGGRSLKNLRKHGGNSLVDNPSSIPIPVEFTLKTGLGSVPNFSSVPGGNTGDGGSGNSIIVDNPNTHGGDDASDSFSGNSNNAGATEEDFSEQQHNNSFDNTPLYLDSSETLINKTYYLDGNNSIDKTFAHSKNGSLTWKSYASNNSIKSSNFIKVTRIKGPPGPLSKETAEKTASTILARRTSKPAVIVSQSAAGTRPKVIGSVVEAGPAWPGLVGNFLRASPNPVNTFNRSFAATATVRPRGYSGTNPAHPTAVINGHVQQQIIQAIPQQLKQQQQPQQVVQHRPPKVQQLTQHPTPTQFQLQQQSFPKNVVKSSSISSVNSNGNRPSASVSTKTRSHVTLPIPATTNPHLHNTSSIISGGATGAKLVKQVSNIKLVPNNGHHPNHNYNGNNNNNNNGTTSAGGRRLYSSEEDSSSAQISRSKSASGIVALVHAHISHCPKLNSPTEIICDVHIREGHGVHNPQLTVGWRRKFYNSTQPDVLLALSKAPASGEHFEPHHSVTEVEPNKGERLEEFHDKFNVTLAPGISPMLRSVLLIRSVAAQDCGHYVCEVNDQINKLQSQTLLFLCH